MSTRIDRYFGYVGEQLSEIDSLPEQLKTHRQILYVAFIDSLSTLVLPAYQNNRARFTDFVLAACAWPNATRISSTHLNRALTLNPDPAFNKVRELLYKTIATWSPGELVGIDRDLEAGTIGTHWPHGKQYEHAVPGAPWLHLRHVELLYAHRNALVHGFRRIVQQRREALAFHCGGNFQPAEIRDGGINVEELHSKSAVRFGC